MFQDRPDECSGFPKEGKLKLAEDLTRQIPPKGSYVIIKKCEQWLLAIHH